MKVLLGYPVTGDEYRAICETVPEWEIVPGEQSALAEKLADCDIFCGHAKVPVDWPGVVRQGRLKWIQSSAAGLDHCLNPSVIESEIQVSSCSGLFRDSVAEQALALLLGLVRGLPGFVKARENRDFSRQPTHDLHGMRVGIAGFGGNGQRIAELLRPIARSISATDLFARELAAQGDVPAIDQLLPPEQLSVVLSNSDVVIATLPLVDSTRYIFDDKAFGQMPRGSWFVNVGRGGLVDEQALLAALASGRLAGAGLDVTFPEPPAPDSPLWDEPRLLLTPHVGAQSASRHGRVTRLFCENLNRFVTGKRLLNLVDKSTGVPHPRDRTPRCKPESV